MTISMQQNFILAVDIICFRPRSASQDNLFYPTPVQPRPVASPMVSHVQLPSPRTALPPSALPPSGAKMPVTGPAESRLQNLVQADADR